MSYKTAISILQKVTTKVLGEPVVYTSIDTSVVTTINGIFSNEFVEINGISSLRPVLRINLADLSTAPLENDTLVVNQINYRVSISQVDGNGGATLILQLD